MGGLNGLTVISKLLTALSAEEVIDVISFIKRSNAFL